MISQYVHDLKKIFKMKKVYKINLWIGLTMILFCFSCKDEKLADNLKADTPSKLNELSQEFKKYWYSGESEISSYKLEQARYGEIRQGNTVLIYVSEDFLPNEQVKADRQDTTNIPVLKLNATKNFNTGIYPYSIMQSVFYPVANNQHALKISCSIQEWCGHIYTQLNNREEFEIKAHSYFEGEADKHFNLNKTILENELWTQLRISPKSLPTGTIHLIPSFEYCRLSHKPLKAYKARASLTSNSYTIEYIDFERSLTINFNTNFPFDILGWEETFKSGFGKNAKSLTTKATKLKTIKSPYWELNKNKNEVLRDTLQLN